MPICIGVQFSCELVPKGDEKASLYICFSQRGPTFFRSHNK